MSHPERADVVIIGSGGAGLRAALAATRKAACASSRENRSNRIGNSSTK